MEIISDKMLYEVKGGGISKTLAAGIAIIGVFIVGVIDGFLRPLKCNR